MLLGFIIFGVIVLFMQEVYLIVSLLRQIVNFRALKKVNEDVNQELNNERFMYKRELERINAPLIITDEITARAEREKVHPSFIAWREAIEREEGKRLNNSRNIPHLHIDIPNSNFSEEIDTPSSTGTPSPVEEVTGHEYTASRDDMQNSLSDTEAKEDEPIYKEAFAEPNNGAPSTSYLNKYILSKYFTAGQNVSK